MITYKKVKFGKMYKTCLPGRNILNTKKFY